MSVDPWRERHVIEITSAVPFLGSDMPPIEPPRETAKKQHVQSGTEESSAITHESAWTFAESASHHRKPAPVAVG